MFFKMFCRLSESSSVSNTKDVCLMSFLNTRLIRMAALVFTTKEFLPTAGLGSGPGSGIAACLGSGISNTTVTNRLIYVFLQLH